MKKISANVCAVTHAGRVRKENEDNYSLNGRLTTGDLKKGSAYVQKMAEPFHLAVCDGMGGESFGEIASGIAVDSIAKSAAGIYNSGEDYAFAIANALDDANSKICSEISARGARMGTTLAAIYAVKGKAICVSMGDTRIYHFSNGILKQMSFDHTHAQQFVDAGAATMSEINTIPDAKHLTKHLGVFPEEAPLSPGVSVIDDIENGDVILLCSDGLTDMLTDDEISLIISGGENAQDVTGKLIRKALENGGKDNVTVVTAFVSVEDTAIFVPIAEAMVGDGANYEEEYRNSYGANVPYGYENNDSPYANADASAAEKPVDIMRWIKIGAIVVVGIIVLLAGAIIIKGAIDKNREREEEEDTTVSTTTTTTEYSTDSSLLTTTTEPTETESETETETETTYSTTRYRTTTKKKSTTKAPSTGTTAPPTSATAPSTEPVSDPTSSTDTSSSSTPSSESTSASDTSSTSVTESSTSQTIPADPNLGTTVQ